MRADRMLLAEKTANDCAGFFSTFFAIRLVKKFVPTCAKYHSLFGAERRGLLMFIHHIIKGVETIKYMPSVFTTDFDRTIYVSVRFPSRRQIFNQRQSMSWHFAQVRTNFLPI